MAREFTQTTINFCGKEYFFKRCSNETLKGFDEELEAKVKEIQPLTDESDLINKKGERLEKQIESTERRIRLMEENDDDYKAILKLQDKLDKLLEEQDKHLEDVKEFNKEHEGLTDKLDKEMNEILAKKVEAMVDGITAKEFIENADAIDYRIAANISKYYEMCMVGERESKIQNEIREDISTFRERQKQL
ncbi:MAG: hypothetical protein IJ122_00530 [Methanobrevibacter sp.]|nr:hypothetical protein [Methanobrevibacter sp.]